MRWIGEWWWNDECDNGGGSHHFWHSLIEQLLGSDHRSLDDGIFFLACGQENDGGRWHFQATENVRPRFFRLISWIGVCFAIGRRDWDARHATLIDHDLISMNSESIAANGIRQLDGSRVIDHSIHTRMDEQTPPICGTKCVCVCAACAKMSHRNEQTKIKTFLTDGDDDLFACTAQFTKCIFMRRMRARALLHR